MCRIARYALKFLLMYKGYMHESKRTGVSLTTKIWALLLKGNIKISSWYFRSLSSSLDSHNQMERAIALQFPIFISSSTRSEIRRYDFALPTINATVVG